MDFIELVKRRSSVRHYDTRPIKKEDIDKCIKAARFAPSACNAQPWQFIIVDTPKLKNRLCDAMLSGVYGKGGMNSFIKDAAAMVVIVTDQTKWFVRVCNIIRNTKMYLVDIGIACDHFTLQATELGIGTCILGWFNERKVKELLGVSKINRVHIIISMGYPSEEFKPREKNRKQFAEISTYMS